MTTTATSFPLFKHTGGGDTAPAFSGLCVYLQFTWEEGSSPLSCGVFLPQTLFKLSLSWLLGGCCCTCLLQPTCCEGFPHPPFSALRVPRPLCYMSFLLLLLIIQFFSFFPGWRSVCPGGYADLAQGPSVACYLVVHVFPSHLGTGIWQWHGSPPGFSI
jgi:hypothetical protein